MRLRTTLLLGGLIGCAIAAGGIVIARIHRDALAEGLLRETFEQGVAFPLEASGTTRVLMGSRWQTGTATVCHEGRAALMALHTATGESTVLDDGARLWRVTEDSLAPLGRSERRVDWALLSANYRVRGGGRRTVASRAAREVRIVSRHTGRTAETLWIDPSTRLVLARDTQDADGHQVVASASASVRRGDAGAEGAVQEALDRRPQAADETPLTDAAFAEQAGFTPVRPQYLPPGYQEIGLYARKCPHGRTYAERLYFDGLRVLSVYQRPGGGPGGGGGQGFGHRHGQARHDDTAEPVLIDEGQAKTVRVRRGRTRVFVTGDLTQEEILPVVNSIP